MLLTVTNISKSPQRVEAEDTGVLVLAPGEGMTAEFNDKQRAYVEACPGHYSVEEVHEDANQDDEWTHPVTAPKPRAKRGRK